MKDALGGTVTIAIITVFIVIALGYLAFNVNYTKAHRMKDRIISIYDYYHGECYNQSNNCVKDIVDYASELGYAPNDDFSCPTVNGSNVVARVIDGLYCEIEYDVTDTNSVDVIKKKYYRIVTKINIQIPVISNIFDFRLFYISGDTKVYTSR